MRKKKYTLEELWFFNATLQATLFYPLLKLRLIYVFVLRSVSSSALKLYKELLTKIWREKTKHNLIFFSFFECYFYSLRIRTNFYFRIRRRTYTLSLYELLN